MKIQSLVAVAAFLVSCFLPGPALAAPPLKSQGVVHHPVSSRNPEVQRLFNDGLLNVYAFNHDEAIRYFKEAIKADPNFAMGYWGIALALGPNINLEADPPRQKAAYEAVQKALSLSENLPEPEKAYIKALATRYTGKADEDLPKLAESYMKAMRELSRRFPDDPDAATLYADSIMNLRPWRLWSADGRPWEGTPEIVAVLESVMRRHPYHIGANHYYIHAVEASPHPEWALPSAERLRGLQLTAGHLVHMPAHIYMRIGDYKSASESNQEAAATDEKFMKSSGGAGVYPMMYYSHNLQFLAVSRGMEGRFTDAMTAAEKVARHSAPHAAHMPMMELFTPTPILILARFQKWQEIMKVPEPAAELPVTRTLWHFARGLSFAATGNLGKARGERDAFLQLKQKVPPEVVMDQVKARDVVQVAQYYLDARIALAEGDHAAAVATLKKGIEAEDAIPYMEPPGWYLPLREVLGGVLLQKGEYREAEKTFREELAKNPRSGRALFGLAESLKGQGRKYEAQLVEREYQIAWANADTELRRERL